jgi:hypothetical protein
LGGGSLPISAIRMAFQLLTESCGLGSRTAKTSLVTNTKKREAVVARAEERQ